MANRGLFKVCRAIATVVAVSSAIAISPAIAQTPAPNCQPRPTSSAPSNPTQGWQDCTSHEGRFAIAMPGQPTPSVQPLSLPTGMAQMHMLILDDETSAYFVAYNDYPNELIKNADLNAIAAVLERAPNFFIEGAKASLIGSRQISLQGNPGRAFEFRLPEGVNGKGRVYWVNNRLYQIIAASPDSQAVDAFLNSFRLVDAQ